MVDIRRIEKSSGRAVVAAGECPLCRQGLLLAVKEAGTGRMLLICDDCESQFSSPTAAESSENALKDEAKKVEPASLEDIKRAGWEVFSQYTWRSKTS